MTWGHRVRVVLVAYCVWLAVLSRLSLDAGAQIDYLHAGRG